MFGLCEGADDTGNDSDGAAYGVDFAQIPARTGEDQDAGGWEDCDVSGSGERLSVNSHLTAAKGELEQEGGH